MKSVYERSYLRITEFNTEDSIATSGFEPTPEPVTKMFERENRYGSYDTFDIKPPAGGWF